MRKNIVKVIEAFCRHEKAKGDSKETCSTDGEKIFSYSTVIAEYLPNHLIKIKDENGFSITTRSQIRAIRQYLKGSGKIACNHTDCNSLGNDTMMVICAKDQAKRGLL